VIVHRERPRNCETPVPELAEPLTRPSVFYVRNHFDPPSLDPAVWRLEVGGRVEHPLSLTLAELRAMPAQTLTVTLECAGNGRAALQPPTDGEPWGFGAVSTATWTGIPLSDVLDRAGPSAHAPEILFRGADRGPVGQPDRIAHFERSLPIDVARQSDALLAYAMNGAPLPIDHGYPLRLIVPGWYGVASVKWLTSIEAITTPFTGYFQAEKYVYEWERDGRVAREPVTRLRVRALITEPRPDVGVEAGDLAIRGMAWSGTAPIARVEVRVGNGSWREARLLGAPSRDHWQPWELVTTVREPGRTMVAARAIDLDGRTQPPQPEWNRLGYGSNAIQEIAVQVR
jgi:DMSO/TMAO reductase YedYZ molybdopterin-dependent catalytic subunit